MMLFFWHCSAEIAANELTCSDLQLARRLKKLKAKSLLDPTMPLELPKNSVLHIRNVIGTDMQPWMYEWHEVSSVTRPYLLTHRSFLHVEIHAFPPYQKHHPNCFLQQLEVLRRWLKCAISMPC
jgi:hypothetical protein